MFKYTLDNKRYHTLNYFLRNKFRSKVFKVPLNANLSCPNKISGGCIYCKDDSQSIIINKEDSIIDQFDKAKTILHQKWPNSKYIAYFQAGTNTYSDVSTLKELFEPLLKINNLVGIAIATRPDSISDDVLNYLSDLNKRTFLSVELGLQSSNDNTLKLINRGHTKKDFTNTIKRLHKNNIFTVVHIINGLPFETEKDMLQTVTYLNELKINAIKIHMLYINKETQLEDLYNNTKFHLLSKEEYINITCKQLRLLHEDIIIERITGDPVIQDLIEPKWLIKKFTVLNDIDKEMVKQNIYQGDNIN